MILSIPDFKAEVLLSAETVEKGIIDPV